MEGVVSVAHHHKNHPSRRKEKQKEKPPLRVAAYCRVSTERPEQETSLDLQVRYYTQMKNISGVCYSRKPMCRIYLVENNARIWARSCGIYTNMLTPQSSARSCLRRSMGNFKVCKIKQLRL